MDEQDDFAARTELIDAAEVLGLNIDGNEYWSNPGTLLVLVVCEIAHRLVQLEK